MENAVKNTEVMPTAAEANALKGIMSVEIIKMVKQGFSKEQIMESLKNRRHELSQKCFQYSKYVA